MAPTTYREREVKLRVPDGYAIPDIAALVPGLTSSAVGAPVRMEATYFDTEQLSLIRWGVTLRRRVGGADEGWHAKLPVSDDDFPGARDEIRMPLTASTSSVPPELADIVAPLARGLRLEAVATVRAVRTPTALATTDGPAIELVDDSVEVVHPDGTVASAYRELELELLDPTAAPLLDLCAEVLIARGAAPGSLSKAAAALGRRAGDPADLPDLPIPEHGLAVDVLRAVLARHARHLVMADVAVRRDLPDSVHQMRVACRRLRSILRTFRPLLDREWADGLREELAWMASELGAIRDTEVLLERLDGIADRLPEGDGARVHASIDPWLRQRLVGARSGALAALRSDRHDWLIDDLVDAVAAPRVLDVAYLPADAVLPDLLARTWKRLARDAKALRHDGPADDWHEARIAAKQARYAAEALAPALGHRVAALGALLKEVTEILGEHQDADVARDVLRERASDADADTAFALGIAHERESILMALCREEFLSVWRETLRAARKAGVRS